MRNKFLVEIVKVGIFTFLVTMTTTLVAQQDKKATDVLNKVSKKYKAYKTIKATFTVTTESAAKKKSSEDGTIYIKNSNFRLDFGGQEIFCDGKSIWTYIKDANEVTIEKYKKDSKVIDPQDIFTIYQKGFKYKYAGSTTRNSKVYEQIKLYPKETNKPYFMIELEISKVNNGIEKMIISAKNGSKTTYTVNTLTPNTALSDSYFKFDIKAHPGCTSTDLRLNAAYFMNKIKSHHNRDAGLNIDYALRAAKSSSYEKRDFVNKI